MAQNHGLPTLGDEEISRDNPRTLVDRNGDRSRCTDPIEYHSLTSGHGLRDVTGTEEAGEPAPQAQRGQQGRRSAPPAPPAGNAPPAGENGAST